MRQRRWRTRKLDAVQPVQALSLEEMNLSDPMFWARPLAEREGAFKTLRDEKPIAFFPPPIIEVPGIDPGNGWYALTRYRDIVDASRQPETFCSGRGATSVVEMPQFMREYFGSMIEMDDPRHKRLRDIVSKAFTLRMVKQIDDYIDRIAVEIIDSIKAKGEVDFVTECSARLPLRVICDMMGVPESQYDFVFNSSNTILGAGDPEYVPIGENPLEAIMKAATGMTQLVTELAQAREKDPTDDLMSALVHAEVDGEKLAHTELCSFFILLTVAGNETTRNAITWGALTLDQHPDQRELWMKDFDGLARPAVEEIVRWATPVINMVRTVATDGATLSGHEFHAGDKVTLFYNSGNRDEDVFDDPYTFNIKREPNNHIGFGGPGPHFCLGANLARQEIRVMFRELFAHLPNLRVAGEPERLLSNFINGIKHLPVQLGKAA